MPKLVVETNEGKVIKVFDKLYPTDVYLLELRDTIEMALYDALKKDEEPTLYLIITPNKRRCRESS